MKKTLIFILSVIMIAGLFAGCGSSGGQQAEPGQSPGGAEQSQTAQQLSAGTVYVPEYLKINTDINNIQNITYYDGMLYFSAYSDAGGGAVSRGAVSVSVSGGAVSSTVSTAETNEDSEAEDDTSSDDEYIEAETDYGMSVYRMKIDGTGLERMENYRPLQLREGSEGSASMSSFCIDNDGNFIVIEQLNYYHFDDERYMSDGTEYYLRKLNWSGEEIMNADISSFAEGAEYAYISAMAADKDGNTVISAGSNGGVIVYSPSGEELFKLDGSNWINSLVKLNDGSVGAVMYENGMTFKTVDMTTKSWSGGIQMPMTAYTLYQGSGDFAFYYTDSTSFYGYNMEKGEGEKILNWIDCDMNPNSISGISVLPDGSIICLMYTYGELGSTIEIAHVTERDASEVKEKTTLTLATMYVDYNVTAAVVEFNKRSQDCRIVVKDYSEYNTQDDYTLGLMKLTNEIITGNVPDLLAAMNLPINRYIAKGLIEDLYPFIDADPNIGRDDLMMDYFKATEVDGSLYQISSSFSLISAVGREDVVGPGMGWTLDEMMQVISTMPGTQIIPNMYNTTALTYLCAMDMGSYVNWKTGECAFDSEEFINLLEFAKMFPEQPDYSSPSSWSTYEDDRTVINDGRAFMSTQVIYDFTSIQTQKSIFGGDIVYKGFPVREGIGNAFYAGNSTISMSSGCADKQAAWEFIRTFLTEDYQNTNARWMFPTNKHSFNKVLEESMKKNTEIDENGVEVEVAKSTMGWGFGASVEIFATTPEERDQIMELIASTDKNMSFDQSMMDIINEEAESFFAGQKSASETAAVIQSRASIYVNEQR